MKPTANLAATAVSSASIGSRFRVVHRSVEQFVGRMASKTMYSFLAQGFFSGTSFATSVIVGRNASKEVLGAYYLGLTLVLILRALQAELITAPFTVFGQGKTKDELAAYTGSTAFFQTFVFFACVPLFVAAAALAQFGVASDNLRPVFWVLAAFAPFLLLREFVRQFSFAQLHVETVAILDAVVGVLQVGGLFWLVTQRAIVAHEVYIVIGAANLLVCVGWLLVRGTPPKIDRSRLLSDWRMNWSFAKWALVSQLICSCTPFVLPWLLAVVHGEGEAGVSAACSSLIGLAFVGTIAVSNLLTPKSAHAFATEGVAGLQRVLLKAAVVYVLGIGCFCLMVYLFIDDILPLVYGRQYAGYGAVAMVFSLALFFNSLSIVGGNGLWAMRMPRANLTGDVATLAATIIAAVFLIQPFGALGAAFASLAGSFFGSAVRGRRLIREMRLSASSQQDTSELVTA